MKAQTLAAVKKIPLDFVYLLAAAVLVMSGIVPAKKLMQSLVNEATASLLFLFVLSKAVVESDLFSKGAARILARLQSKRFFLPLFSGFLGGLLSPSFRLQKLVPSTLYYSLVAGSACTIIGSGTALSVNYLLKSQYPGVELSFLEMAGIGILSLLGASLYSVLDRTAIWPYDRSELAKPISSAKKGWGIFFLFGTAVLAPFFGVPLAWSSFIAAALLLLLKFSKWKTAAAGFPWEFALLLIASFVFSFAVSDSALAANIAYPLALLGNIHPTLLLAGLYLATFALSHLFFPVAAAVVMLPIASQAVQFSGFDETVSIKQAALAIVFASNFSFLRKKRELPGFCYGNGDAAIDSPAKKAILSLLFFFLTIGAITIFY